MKAATPGPAIEIRGLAKSFGIQPALRGIDLEVEPGKTLAIFGPNGAGKSTLIKILATIMKPSAGEVSINGLNLKQNAEAIRCQIGVVCHQTFLYGNLTAYENLHFYCRMYDVPESAQRIRRVVAMVAMETRLHDRVGTLSRGMQQRLSIARCLLHKPTIVLLDEPETGLDQQAIPLLWAALREDDAKRTILFTSHSLERGLSTCDRLVILNQGQIVYQSGEKIDLTALRQAYRESTGAGDEICK